MPENRQETRWVACLFFLWMVGRGIPSPPQLLQVSTTYYILRFFVRIIAELQMNYYICARTQMCVCVHIRIIMNMRKICFFTVVFAKALVPKEDQVVVIRYDDG